MAENEMFVNALARQSPIRPIWLGTVGGFWVALHGGFPNGFCGSWSGNWKKLQFNKVLFCKHINAVKESKVD